MQFHHLLSRRQFEERFGPVVGADGAISRTENDLLGPHYRSILTEMCSIVSHQWRSGIRRGAIKGYFLSGPPGIGKTSLALRVAYELSLQFTPEVPPEGDDAHGGHAAHGAHDGHAAQGAHVVPTDGNVVLALIDGGDIARSRYGESEERLREVFARAEKGFSGPNERTIILFDDVESILMARGSSNAKEWHFSQDSVFFHSVDELDTSRTAVILTSNRPDLVDDAIRDRFLAYSLTTPDPELMVEVALRRADEHRFTAEQRDRLAARVWEHARAGQLHSVREAERLVVRQYVEDVLGHASVAQVPED